MPKELQARSFQETMFYRSMGGPNTGHRIFSNPGLSSVIHSDCESMLVSA